MQHPGHGVAGQLQNHVHLISAHPFPITASLDLDTAFRYLLDAPVVVKQHRPMSWIYVTPPQDGTIWLEWLPPDRNDQIFPSDGFIWGDLEQTFRQECRGYTIELRVHTVGYRPGLDHIAAHARTRYHIIAKNPSIPAAPPDPSLWIVHYHAADPARAIPANQLPILPQMHQIMQQRRWLEGLGALERREFMLHDREHWPTLNLPNSAHMQQPGYHGAPMPAVPMAHARYPSQPMAQGGGGGPPPKRPRTQGPSISGPSEPVHDTAIEDEENTALGDFFDHVTQRDISLARYMQHHHWMEEVFSSPYASNQIVPVNLGLGLMGELKGLTDGILEAPNMNLDPAAEGPNPSKAIEPDPFTNLKTEKVDEFRKRVEKHLADGEAEIQRMKDEHAAKMQDWKKVKSLMLAEKRLRYSTWPGHESAFRLEDPSPNGQNEDAPGGAAEDMDDVVKDVERMLKVHISAHAESREVAKGGLQERVLHLFDDNDDRHGNPADNEEISSDVQQRALAVADHHPSSSSANPQMSTTPHQQRPQFVPPLPATATATPNPLPGSAPGPAAPANNSANTAGEALDDLPDLNESMLDDMDIDVDAFDPDAAADTQHPGPSTSTAPATNPSASNQPGNTNQSMFPDSTFDDLAGLGNAGDEDDADADALLDFDDSAFGDALHGMDDGDGVEG